MSIRFRWVLRELLAASLVIGGLSTVSLAATAALTPGTASAAPATLFSSTTTGTYAVTVPAGITSLTITAVGGTGGSFGANGDNPGSAGGEGGVLTSTVTVAPGESLTVIVGADGHGQGGSGGTGAGTGGGGGGDGAGGGGGSAVFDGGTPLEVAAGGGGAGNELGPSAVAGGNADQNGGLFPIGGGAATLTEPGAAGFGSVSGDPGSGMDGGNGQGGGGGGGYFGGGGGGNFKNDAFGGGGGGSSFPSATTQWDVTATPSVTVVTSPFFISTTSLPTATPGAAYGPVTLQAANVDLSASPYVTTLKWKKISLTKGLKLSSTGVLSGSPNDKLAAGPSSITVQVTEKVTTLNDNKKVKTKTTAQSTIPLTIG
jgi:Glycine rich protein